MEEYGARAVSTKRAVRIASDPRPIGRNARSSRFFTSGLGSGGRGSHLIKIAHNRTLTYTYVHLSSLLHRRNGSKQQQKRNVPKVDAAMVCLNSLALT